MQQILKYFLLFAAFIALTKASSDWGYPDLDTNQDEPFPNWGGVCDNGIRQSPINLRTKDALKGDFQSLHFDDYDDEQRGITIVNNGHSIQLSGFDHEMELNGGALIDDFVVEQIHLHWWSEHTINDIRYPLEVHIVHRNKIYPNMSMAANFKDGITVVGVLYHVSHTPNDAITGILQSLDSVKSYTQLNKPTKMKSSFVVRDLFPEINGYFTYAGSLTTPNCAESVTWIVLTETFPVTLEQVDEFKEVEYAPGKQLHNNFRTLQSSHNRAVVLVTLDQRGNGGGVSVSSMFSLSATLLLAGMVKLLQ